CLPWKSMVGQNTCAGFCSDTKRYPITKSPNRLQDKNMTPQSTFMITATVRVGELQNLRTLLASMNKIPGHADPDNTLVPFGKFDRLHFARFVIIESKTLQEIREFGVKPRP